MQQRQKRWDTSFIQPKRPPLAIPWFCCLSLDVESQGCTVIDCFWLPNFLLARKFSHDGTIDYLQHRQSSSWYKSPISPLTKTKRALSKSTLNTCRYWAFGNVNSQQFSISLYWRWKDLLPTNFLDFSRLQSWLTTASSRGCHFVPACSQFYPIFDNFYQFLTTYDHWVGGLLSLILNNP